MQNIIETTGVSGRVLIAGDVHAVHFPATQLQAEEWHIRRLGLPGAVVRTEEDARVWLEFLAGGDL